MYLSDKYDGKPGNIAAKCCLDRMNVPYIKYLVEDNSVVEMLLNRFGIDFEKEKISRKRERD